MAILVVPMILSFAIWGVGDIFRGRTSNAVATVGDLEITANELGDAFRDTVRGLQAQFGMGFTAEQARDMGLVDYALESLVTNRLYDLETETLGLAVGDDVVLREIRSMPTFWNVDGAFDQGIFAAVLANSGRTEQQFVALLREDLRRTQLRGVVSAGIEAPDAMVDALFRRRAEERIVQYFVVANDSIYDVRTPEESELAAFHEDNAARFTAPEYRSLIYVYVTPNDIADEIAVPEEDVAAEYEDRLEEFVEPERRTVEQFVLADQATATDAYDRIAAGEDFLAVAADTTGVDAGGATLGSLTRRDLLKEFADVVFSLDDGAVSPPVESPLGWHVFRVTAIEPESIRSMEEVHIDLEHDIALRLAADALYQLGIRLDDALGGGATLEEAADQLALPLSRVAAIDGSGLDANGAPVEGLPDARGFLPTTFSSLEGETSLLNETADGSYYVLRVNSITPPALRPLDTIRGEVAAAWREAEQAKIAAGRAEEAAAAINAGASIAEQASGLGVEPLISAPFRRDGTRAGLEFAAELVLAVFAADVGEAADAATPDGGGRVVARLSEIVPADPGAAEDELARMRDSLGAAIANDLDVQFRNHLEQRYPVERMDGAINALF